MQSRLIYPDGRRRSGNRGLGFATILGWGSAIHFPVKSISLPLALSFDPSIGSIQFSKVCSELRYLSNRRANSPSFLPNWLNTNVTQPMPSYRTYFCFNDYSPVDDAA